MKPSRGNDNNSNNKTPSRSPHTNHLRAFECLPRATSGADAHAHRVHDVDPAANLVAHLHQYSVRWLRNDRRRDSRYAAIDRSSSRATCYGTTGGHSGNTQAPRGTTISRHESNPASQRLEPRRISKLDVSRTASI